MKTFETPHYTATCLYKQTRNGFIHRCTLIDNTTGKEYRTIQHYINRTYERFEYESVLKNAIRKLPKKQQPQAEAELIEHFYKLNLQESQEMYDNFKTNYDKLPERFKQVLKEQTPHIQTPEQAKSLTGLLAIINATYNK